MLNYVQVIEKVNDWAKLILLVCTLFDLCSEQKLHK